MADYFGKGCKFFSGQWERDSNEAVDTPVLNYCSHADNTRSHEGNCAENLCPLWRVVHDGPSLAMLAKGYRVFHLDELGVGRYSSWGTPEDNDALCAEIAALSLAAGKNRVDG